MAVALYMTQTRSARVPRSSGTLRIACCAVDETTYQDLQHWSEHGIKQLIKAPCLLTASYTYKLQAVLR